MNNILNIEPIENDQETELIPMGISILPNDTLTYSPMLQYCLTDAEFTVLRNIMIWAEERRKKGEWISYPEEGK